MDRDRDQARTNATLDAFAGDSGDSDEGDVNDERDDTDAEQGVREAVVFDVSADAAHFRVPHAAPSYETYGIPPRTTVAGMVAGMLGLGRDSYYDTFDRANSRIAVSVEAPIRRQMLGMDYVNTEGSTSKTKGANVAKHIGKDPDPTAVSLLMRPRYRLYVGVSDPETMDRIDAVVRGADPDADGGDAPVYTPTLGKAQHIARIEHVGRYAIEQAADADQEQGDGTVAIRSAVPGEEIPLVVDPNRRYISERMTAHMTSDDSTAGRTPDGGHTLTYTPSGKPVRLRERAADYATVGEDHVVLS